MPPGAQSHLKPFTPMHKYLFTPSIFPFKWADRGTGQVPLLHSLCNGTSSDDTSVF